MYEGNPGEINFGSSQRGFKLSGVNYNMNLTSCYRYQVLKIRLYTQHLTLTLQIPGVQTPALSLLPIFVLVQTHHSTRNKNALIISVQSRLLGDQIRNEEVINSQPVKTAISLHSSLLGTFHEWQRERRNGCFCRLINLLAKGFSLPTLIHPQYFLYRIR